ncbi:unnamed protein product [Clonostachys chloroleuca]|uniref:Rhodopsin domain-containing protein n=1 Tax=Clonostachys chloroleuca TaxID=1926264 RepID=A0AA35MHS2_9HYPO|nr:unnamed protein product [Clonostachys chloroleuca]
MASNVSYPGGIPPPLGLIPDLERPYGSRQQFALGIAITCIGLASLFFFTRLYVRLRITRAMLAEDGVHNAHQIIAIHDNLESMLIFLPVVHYGMGLHAWDVSPKSLSHHLQWLYIASTIYCPAAFFTKVSLLLLIARVFTVRRGISTAIYIFIGTLFIAYIIIEVLKIIICIPIQAFWNRSVNGKCFNQPILFVADTSIAILTDIVVLLAPIPLTWSMRLPFKKKIKIISIMGIGGIAVGITIWRVVLVVEYLHATDATWWIALLISTAVMELSIGLICSCIPAINILIQERKYPGSRYSSGHSTHKHAINCKGKGTEIWHSERTASLTNETVETSEPAFPKIDSQLAMLARLNPAVVRDGSLEERIRAGQGDEKDLLQLIQLRNSVLTSIGRREGWLAEDKGESSYINCEGETQPADSRHVPGTC